jgi:hypothetical protein
MKTLLALVFLLTGVVQGQVQRSKPDQYKPPMKGNSPHFSHPCNGAVQVWAVDPHIGSQLQVNVLYKEFTFNVAAWVFMGYQFYLKLDVYGMRDCVLHVLPFVTVPFVLVRDNQQLNFNIPPHQVLVGAQLRIQAMVYDPAKWWRYNQPYDWSGYVDIMVKR